MKSTTYLGDLEKAVIKHLALNKNQGKKEVATGLKYEKAGQINKQMDRLKEKGLVESFSTHVVKGNEVIRWGLTEAGVREAILLGADIQSIINNYSNHYGTVKTLQIIDEVVGRELKFWKEDRGRVLQQLYVTEAAVIKAGITDEAAVMGAVGGVFKAYTDRKIKAKKMTAHQVRKIGEKLSKRLGGVEKTMKLAGYDYKL